MESIRIITWDGKIHTEPQGIAVPRNEKYAAFYRIVDNYEPEEKKEGTVRDD